MRWRSSRDKGCLDTEYQVKLNDLKTHDYISLYKS